MDKMKRGRVSEMEPLPFLRWWVDVLLAEMERGDVIKKDSLTLR